MTCVWWLGGKQKLLGKLAPSERGSIVNMLRKCWQPHLSIATCYIKVCGAWASLPSKSTLARSCAFIDVLHPAATPVVPPPHR